MPSQSRSSTLKDSFRSFMRRHPLHSSSSPPPSSSKSSSGGRANKSRRESFALLRAQVYTKGERNDFHYSPMFAAKIPLIKVDPPDDVPFELVMEELKIGDEEVSESVDVMDVVDSYHTPPGSPRLSLVGTTVRQELPPSPPDSPVSPTRCPPLVPFDLPTSPTRSPPSPPLPTSSLFLSLSDDILLRIFSHSPTISTAATLSLTHPRLHAIFSQNQHLIHRRILCATAPSTFRFLDLIRPQGGYTASSYAEHYSVSLDTVATIHALIHTRCCSFLTAEENLEEALFNVWAFCIQFGSNNATPHEGGESNDACAQLCWLRKFPLGELLSMLKAWNCLTVLLRPFLSEERLAMMYGVVKPPPPPPSPPPSGSLPVAMTGPCQVLEQLEDFVAYLQTKGLETLLPIVRWSTDDHNQRWAIVNAKGLNRFREHAGRGREEHRRFLKEAVGKVYMEKSIEEMEGRKRGRRRPSASASAGSCAEGWGPTIEF